MSYSDETKVTVTAVNWDKHQHYQKGQKRMVWLKLYATTPTDYKIKTMNDRDFRTLMLVLCMCCEDIGSWSGELGELADTLGFATNPDGLRKCVKSLSTLAEKGRLHVEGLDVENAQEPLKSAENPPVSEIKVDDEGFDAFWEAYPKKCGKSKAFEKWVIARRNVSHETLTAKAKEYAKWCAKTEMETRYMKNPATWLHQGCWEDQLDSPMSSSKSLQSAANVLKDFHG